MRQRDERRAVGIDGKSERCERPRGCRHGIGNCAGYSTVPKGHDIDCPRKRIGFQRHEQTLLVEHTHLCRAANGRRSASHQLQRGGPVPPHDIVVMQLERIDSRRPCHIHVIVAKIYAHRSARRGHNPVETQPVSMAFEQRYRIRSVIHDGNELTVELLDASRITADAALALGGEGLEQGLGASVVDLDLVRLRIVRHHHGQRGAALIGMDARHTCCEDQ